jgi:hypothetical protein
MRLWCGAEAEKTVHLALTATRNRLKNALTNTLKSGSMADIDLELCYIPIVMSDDFVELYPARSSYSKIDKRVYHSPQLNFETFRDGSSKERDNAFIEGLLLAKSFLSEAGIEERQVTDFEKNLCVLLK